MEEEISALFIETHALSPTFTVSINTNTPPEEIGFPSLLDEVEEIGERGGIDGGRRDSLEISFFQPPPPSPPPSPSSFSVFDCNITNIECS
jgi:hypothetical protein